MVEGGGGGPDHRGTSPRSPDEIHLSMAPKSIEKYDNLHMVRMNPVYRTK